MNAHKPNEGDYPVFYSGYIGTLEDLPLIECLEKETQYAFTFLKQIDPKKSEHQYAEGKWTIKQVMMHIIDTEVVFGYRGLAIARGETQALPGFHQDEYMSNVSVENSSLEELVACFQHLRSANVTLFKILRDSDLDRIGTASGYEVASRTLGYFIAGHCRYHLNILQERYGV